MVTNSIDDDYLALSGIQHFAYCPRQWALIHIEKLWAENLLTVEGNIMHEKVDNPFLSEARKGIRIVRALPIVSKELGLQGIIDAMEIVEGETGEKGKITIIEYKRGRPKADDIDEVQVCAQAMCLEEMLGITQKHGFLFYGQTRRRVQVDYSTELRHKVKKYVTQMHDIFGAGKTPMAISSKKCRNCSMEELCVPNLAGKSNKVQKYITKNIAGIIKDEDTVRKVGDS